MPDLATDLTSWAIATTRRRRTATLIKALIVATIAVLRRRRSWPVVVVSRTWLIRSLRRRLVLRTPASWTSRVVRHVLDIRVDLGAPVVDALLGGQKLGVDVPDGHGIGERPSPNRTSQGVVVLIKALEEVGTELFWTERLSDLRQCVRQSLHLVEVDRDRCVELLDFGKRVADVHGASGVL